MQSRRRCWVGHGSTPQYLSQPGKMSWVSAGVVKPRSQAPGIPVSPSSERSSCSPLGQGKQPGSSGPASPPQVPSGCWSSLSGIVERLNFRNMVIAVCESAGPVFSCRPSLGGEVAVCASDLHDLGLLARKNIRKGDEGEERD